MSDRALLQDQFLNHLRKNKTQLSLFLVNGVKLQGIVTGFDPFCLLLKSGTQQQLIYKSAISTIAPMTPVDLATTKTDDDV